MIMNEIKNKPASNERFGETEAVPRMQGKCKFEK
jgi:hypothetical protein